MARLLPLVRRTTFGILWTQAFLVRGESVTSTPSGGDAIAPGSRVIEVRVAELRQLFNAIDPSPFRERDLDPNAEQFIVDWARDLPRDVPLELRVHLERCAGPADEAALLGQAIHQHFKVSAAASRRTWRPLEVFLYDWWPIWGDIRLFDRLSRMPVRIEYNEEVSDEAWRSDWPAVPTSERRASNNA